MTDFDILGIPKKKKQAEPNIFRTSLDFGLNPRKGKPKNLFDIGFGSKVSSKTQTERDTRRSFSPTQRSELWAQQDGKCGNCHKSLDMRTVEYDHTKAWAAKGKTITENGAALCPQCHKLKTHKERLKKVDKKRVASDKVDSVADLNKNLFGF